MPLRTRPDPLSSHAIRFTSQEIGVATPRHGDSQLGCPFVHAASSHSPLRLLKRLREFVARTEKRVQLAIGTVRFLKGHLRRGIGVVAPVSQRDPEGPLTAKDLAPIVRCARESCRQLLDHLAAQAVEWSRISASDPSNRRGSMPGLSQPRLPMLDHRDKTKVPHPAASLATAAHSSLQAEIESWLEDVSSASSSPSGIVPKDETSGVLPRSALSPR